MPRHVSPITQPGYRLGVPSSNKGKKYPADVLTRDEVLALIDACNCGLSGLRNRAIITTLWRTGVRVGECCGLYPVDFDMDRNCVRVKGSKTAHSDRVVGIDRQALLVIRDWLDVRADAGISRYAPAFCCISKHEKGNPVKPTYVRQMLKHCAAKAGLEKRVHPHALRHTHAAELATEKVDLRVVQKQLGHSNLATTDRYVSHLNPVAVIEAMSGRKWAA